MSGAFKLFQVDAFAAAPFTGNPAAVMKLGRFFSAELMQNIAEENNLPETAFVVARPPEAGCDLLHFDLRWFTPTKEIDFCGHATLAAAHILASEYHLSPPFVFHTRIGRLSVSRSIDGGSQDGEDSYCLNAPIAQAAPAALSAQIRAAFPMALTEAFTAAGNLYVAAQHERDVRGFVPVRADILPLSTSGVGLTAPGSGRYACVSRFFVPAEGIDEDPVTGSAHAAIGPYWAQKLGKTELIAYQASPRGGELGLRVRGDTIDITGPAITVLRGEIFLPPAVTRA